MSTNLDCKSINAEIIKFVELIFDNNDNYSKQYGYNYFNSFANSQSPKATVVMCSDSRIQTTVFDGNNSVNHLFLVRNIGNQIITSQGSVEFGVRNLSTPILMIIGHSGCGAIETALKDFTNEPISIQKELTSLKITKGKLNDAILFNLNRQVNEALVLFNDLIEDNKLVILGLVYDFRNDFNYGYGRLVLVNLNGEQNSAKIRVSLKTKNKILVGIK